MSYDTLKVAALAALPTIAAAASALAQAKAPAPLIPTALVEDIKSSTAEVEFMDYVGNGQVIKLARPTCWC
jgi:hypothetical protein